MSQTASAVSSYNQVNGIYASEHHDLLSDILKHGMDFNGYVMSDWWAQMSGMNSAAAGLDMTAPGERTYGGDDTYL